MSMSQNRTRNAKRNIYSGFVNKIITLLLPFILRTVIIKALGAEYLGLGSLFTSILQVLSMAELGFSSAIVFSLYKPLAMKDTEMIRALLAFYRRMYRLVGTVIMIAGLIILPFLHKLIHGEVPDTINIYFLYSIYLVNTVISYFAFAYKSALLTADQRQDVINNISTILHISVYVIQIVIILSLKNYYLYALMLVISTIANNIIVAIVTKKRYPQYFCEGELEPSYRDSITTQIKGLAIGKFAKTARNSFDSVVLSMFCGLTDVAIYSNYYYIFNAILGFISIILISISAGVGNSIATESMEKNYNDFKKFHFYVSWIGSWCTICLFCLYQPFMQFWVGKDLTASSIVMVSFCVYFYITQIGQVRAVYSSSSGLWWEFRWLEIGEMFANLGLNFLLGYFFGMEGILLATIITVFLFSVIGITNKTFVLYFKRSSKGFHLTNLLFALITVVSGLFTYLLCSLVVIKLQVLQLFIRAILCLIVPNILFLGITMFNPEYKRYLISVKSILHA